MLEFRSRELTLVRRLRIAGAGLDPVTSRLRAGQAFASLDLAGLGLPPSTVLCIRALADPRPGSCRFGPEGLRLTTAWRDSLRSEIERKARRAPRPARERVAASADCVLFADAAAQARDADPSSRAGSTPSDERSDALAGGGAGARPPWHELVPECAGARLDAAGESLLGIGLALSRAPALARREDFARRAAAWARHAARTDAREDADAGREHEPRLRPAVASASTTRGRGEVERGPHGLPGPAHSAPDTRGEQVRAQGGDAAHGSARTPDAGAKNGRRPARAVDDDEGTGDAHSQNVIARAATSAGEGGDAAPESSVSRGAGAGDSRGAELDPRRGEAGESPAGSSRREARVAPVLEAEIETRFGGLFHLVNLGLFLNLYGDFTTPSAPGLPLPVWDFVALLGRRFAGARVERDAVWPLLARLSGRGEGDEPGARFSPPDEWRVPADWVKPFGAACVLRWSEVGGRLRVAHPAGFTLLDVALDEPTTTRADAEGRLARELQPYLAAGARFEARRVARVRGARGRTARARWLDRVSAYAFARLALALGAADASRLSSLLCERRARVFVTAAHVDVVMRLGELPLEVRCAGLDRDPGWVPAAGRHVAFHFE
ncbi:MAG: hypothetical protein LC800_01735 [Acidobacteria bacterium]|nr:hypothetical protein [Acidobacteriota bacterium]